MDKQSFLNSDKSSLNCTFSHGTGRALESFIEIEFTILILDGGVGDDCSALRDDSDDVDDLAVVTAEAMVDAAKFTEINQ